MGLSTPVLLIGTVLQLFNFLVNTAKLHILIAKMSVFIQYLKYVGAI